MGRITFSFVWLFFMLFIHSCSEEDLVSERDSFLKILDDTNAEVNYHPIDIIELENAFLVLAGTTLTNTDFQGVQLIRTTKNGDFIEEEELPNLVVPIKSLHLQTDESDSIISFIAMNPTTLNPVRTSLTTQLDVLNEESFNGLQYPLAASTSEDNDLILLSYNPVNAQSVVSEIRADGSANSAAYSIGPGDDVEEDIINHYLGASERSLPFFCGKTTDGIAYFNGFYNFTFSLVFTDFGASPSGVVQGQSTNAGTRALLPLGARQYAISGFQFEENFQVPSIELSNASISSSADLFTENLPNVREYSPTEIILYNNSDEYVIFGSETKGRQIVLNFYNRSIGNILSGAHRIGISNPFEFSTLTQTTDAGIVVLGTTFVAGRFQRIALIKLSAQEIAAINS
ncbi:MAG: hypothetical protein AAF789_05670 [Bacteroidota bacterium]